jgi:vitamin B12 transporter
VGGKRVNLTDTFSLVANARYADGKTDIDGYDANFNFGDTPNMPHAAVLRPCRVALCGQRADPRWRLQHRDHPPPRSPAGPTTRSNMATTAAASVELTGRYDLPADFALDFGADNEWTGFSSTYDSHQTASLTSGHALLGWYGQGQPGRGRAL